MPKKSGNKDTPVSRPALNKIKPKGPSSIFHQERHSVGSPALTRTPTRPLIRGSDVSVRVSTPEIYTAVRFEQQQRKQLYSELGAGIEKANLIVAVRVRPQTFKEERDKEMKQCVNVRNNEVSVETEYGQTHNFTYDHCFSCCDAENEQFGGQETVYSKLAKPLLAKAFEGFNTCLFAYGQTGSGKSYSIMGNIGSNESLDEKAGVVPRFCFDLFRNIESASLRCKSDNIEVQISYFEIYKEKIQDLLSPAKTSLRVREHPQTVSVVSSFSCLILTCLVFLVRDHTWLICLITLLIPSKTFGAGYWWVIVKEQRLPRPLTNEARAHMPYLPLPYRNVSLSI